MRMCYLRHLWTHTLLSLMEIIRCTQILGTYGKLRPFRRATYDEFDCISSQYLPSLWSYDEVIKLTSLTIRLLTKDEDEMRFEIFRNNLMRSQQHQLEDRATAKFGVTKFSDLTEAEFAALYTNSRMRPLTTNSGSHAEFKNLPEAHYRWDWREHGAVGQVEDQGLCGSCWAFSVVGAIEGQWFKKTSNLLRLSKQQLLDCDYKDDGCFGGYPPVTMKEIQKMGGLMLESDYPYLADSHTCTFDENKIRVYINRTVELPLEEETQREYLSLTGPLSVALNAEYLQFYLTGVIHPPTWKCSALHLTHAVLTTGYDYEGIHPFWNVRNSWGMDWGEEGYFRIFRGDGTCGINRLAVTTTIF